jgi:tRNA(Ile)-lysidine synthase
MIKISVDIPRKVAIAVSGGADSMAALDFLKRCHDVTVLHYNHGTGKYANDATNLVRDYCDKHNIFRIIGWNHEEMPLGVSAEAWWREKRYNWFETATNLPIITGHHLDDAVETWVFTSLHGNPQIIPSVRGRYLRPFLTTTKKDFTDWCERKEVPSIDDPSNLDTRYMRNYIRHTLIPAASKVNPGLRKTIKKKIKKNPVLI